MANLKVSWEPLALFELLEAKEYLHLGNPKRALEFADAVTRAQDILVRFPRAGGSSLEARVYRLSRFPYSIIYVVLPSEVRIIALAHHARRPGYWRDRLD